MNKPSTEFNYDVAVFKIIAKSNLHVGAGGENYWIIDNLVQRDPATNLPCIYSSSLKGAIREFMKYYLQKTYSIDWLKKLDEIFGHDKSDVPDEDSEKYNEYFQAMDKEAALKSENSNVSEKEKEYEKGKGRKKPQIPGKYRFLQAELLSLPVRSDKRMFYRVTSPYLLDNFQKKLKQFKLKILGINETITNNVNQNSIPEKRAYTIDLGNAVLEEDDIRTVHNDIIIAQDISVLVGTNYVLANDNVLMELTDDYHLPVLARNHLEDGTSTNLWYEQVLPQETTFFFMVLYPKGDSNFTEFKNHITQIPIQIGANASIGYGFCRIEEIPIDIIA
jgi:CRISPR-associated protein Cmr4